MLADKILIRDLARVLRQLPHVLRWKTYALFFLMFLVVIFEVLSILSMSFTAMSVAAPQVLLQSSYTQTVFFFFPSLAHLCQDPRFFTLIASLGVVTLTAVKNGLSAFLFWKQAVIAEDVSIYAGDAIMEHYLNSSYMWHISGDSAQTYMALGARQSLSQFLMQILNVYTYAGTSIALVFILVSATPSMILLILVITGAVSFIVYASMKKALDRCAQVSVQSAENEARTRNNAMHGIREVLIYRQQPIFQQKFREACLFGKRARSFLCVAPSIPAWVLEVYGFVAIPFTTWVLIRFYNADMTLIAGVVSIVMLAAWRILPLLNRSLSSLVMVRSYRPMALLCLQRLEKVKKGKRQSRVEPVPSFYFDRKISLENVSFRYPGAPATSLVGIDCLIPKGKQVGLIGISGSGKSTLAGIFAGLMEPETGIFQVDGRALSPAALSAYRSTIGYVPQTPYLMAGSIAENVAFSQWGKPYDAERVRAACRMAALDIVENDPRGIDYPLEENGAGLSGGQAQRVAIARALYARPEILILDESTSALDQQTEAAIMQTIHGLKGKLTMIIITHRLTTVEQCDWLIWMENGRIRKQGPTESVLSEYRQSLSVA